MNHLFFKSLILASMLAFASAAFGQADEPSASAKPAKAKTSPAKGKTAKFAPAKLASAKAAPAKAAPSKPVPAPVALAQSTAEQPATVAPAAEHQPMSEDDSLPFMREESTAAPAEPSSGGLVLKSIGALLLVIGLLVFGTWSMKKLGFGNKAAKGANAEFGMEVLSTLPMGGGKTISMVQFGERVLLVGSTAQSFTLLAEQGPAGNTFETAPRSVADLLADDDNEGSFDDEFERAMAHLEGRVAYGGIA